MFRQFLESYIFGLDFTFFKTYVSLKVTQKDKSENKPSAQND